MTDGSKPIILLVHGAVADGSSWSKVLPILQDAGHRAVAVQQPLSSIADDVAKVRGVLDELGTPVVVVGHSFGGVVITQAAHNAANVSALVYVAAFAPDEGETAATLGEPYGQLPSASHFAIDKQGRFTLPQELFPQFFCPDVDPVEARVMAAVQGPSDAARFGFVSGPPALARAPHSLRRRGERPNHPARPGALHGRAHGRRNDLGARCKPRRDGLSTTGGRGGDPRRRALTRAHVARATPGPQQVAKLALDQNLPTS